MSDKCVIFMSVWNVTETDPGSRDFDWLKMWSYIALNFHNLDVMSRPMVVDYDVNKNRNDTMNIEKLPCFEKFYMVGT